MASVIPHGDTWRIGFTGLDRKRRTIYAGKCSERNAHELRRLVERILEAAALGESLDPKTASRIAALPDTTYEKLVSVALVNPREKPGRMTVGEFADEYVKRRTELRPSSRIVFEHVARNLRAFFKGTPLADVTAGDCDDFGRWLGTEARTATQVERKGAALSPATVGKRLQLASTIFGDALKRRLISENPFRDTKKPGAANPDRQQYVPAASVETLIERETDLEWRALLALARYLGLRTPSEPFSLTWDCVDWEKRRIRINSPKTERIGKPYRVAPILPEVMPHLEALYAAAPEGTVYVLDRLRQRDSVKATQQGFWGSINLRTRLEKMLKRAGIEQWPRLWHALRASAETDLAARFPVHVVAGWLGNTPKIAAKHYLMTTDADFDLASGNATHFTTHAAPETGGMQRNATHVKAENPAKHGVFASLHGGGGNRTPVL
jgi:integrase